MIGARAKPKSDLRICVECRHHVVEPLVPDGRVEEGDHRCRHPKVAQVNRVTGELYKPACCTERSMVFSRACGVDGNLWEPLP